MVAVSERGYFHWIDWLVFALMLVVSAAAGLWHFKRAQKSNTQDYLLGGKSLGLFPVSASLVASFISGVTILGTPAEIYNFGTQYWITIISIFFAGIVVATIYLPVFTTLRLSSVYEYLEIRFSRAVRILISFIFVFDVILYQSIVVYVPALALNQVSGIDIHLIGMIVCGVCVFYTVLGGIRAVVWTDALQVGVMVAAVISVTVLGTYQIGGMSEVWNRAAKLDRIEFLNFDPSPYTRHTVWTVLFGSWLYCVAYISVNQTMVQRYRSLESTRMSQWSIALFTIGVMVFVSLCCWCGLVLLAWWSPPKCDPRASGLITADDQLLPAYVMEIARHLHGIPGLFVAGIFGAALSSLSVGLNSTSVVILEDFVKGCFNMKPSEQCSNIFVKLVVVVLGLIALSFIFLVEKLGGVLSVTNGLAAVAAGTSFGVFTLGILFPWANSKGAFIGTIAGFVVSGWASFGANAATGSGVLIPKKLPVPLSHCGNISQDFLDMFKQSDDANVFPMYRLSYHWFAPLGTVVVLLVGGLVTWITGATDPSSVDRTLLSPVIHRWLPQQKYSNGINECCRQASSDQQTSTDLFLTNLRRKSHPDVKKGENIIANGSL